MQKINWTDHVRNEKVLQRVKEERNILHRIKRRNANWIGHILRRNCLLKHFTEGKVEGWGDEEEDVRNYWITLKIQEFERGITRSHTVENSLWKRLWTCRKTDYVMSGVLGIIKDSISASSGTNCLIWNVKYLIKARNVIIQNQSTWDAIDEFHNPFISELGSFQFLNKHSPLTILIWNPLSDSSRQKTIQN